MKYKKISSIEQYNEYCSIHEKLFLEEKPEDKDEIELLEILIDEYDKRGAANKAIDLNPVELLRSLLADNGMKQVELATDIDVSPQIISDILNYRRNISKDIVLKLSDYFAMSQEAFSRPYVLKGYSGSGKLIYSPDVKTTSKKKAKTAVKKGTGNIASTNRKRQPSKSRRATHPSKKR